MILKDPSLIGDIAKELGYEVKTSNYDLSVFTGNDKATEFLNSYNASYIGIGILSAAIGAKGIDKVVKAAKNINLAKNLGINTKDLADVLNAPSGQLTIVGGKSFTRQGNTVKNILDDIPKSIHQGQQGKHILGHNNFDPTRSALTVNANELLNGLHKGSYSIIHTDNRGRLVVDFGKHIGSYIQEGKAGVPTQYSTIHYGKNGAHIVPASPSVNGGK